MRTNLKEAEPVETDELTVLRGDADAATENKSRAEEALAHARVRLKDLEAKAKAAPRGAALEAILRDQLVAEKMIDVLSVDVADTEVARVAAEDRVSKVARERAEVAAAAAVAEHDAKIAPATQALEEAAEALLKACDTRVRVIEAAGSAHGSAAAYGIPAGPQAETTREVLGRVQRKTGIRIELGPPGPIGVVG